MIENHNCAGLSELDLRIARAVPPGGNWRDIPEDVPSDRIAQIRLSAAAGKGSRSTYYGRLHPNRPSYTIGTYYNRPGNGCFLHHDPNQNRTISHREAARLQSFPDSFSFLGPQRAVCQQIGNAVPPLLAFQIARAFGDAGQMVDVFAGAGGLSLGFKWAGWDTLAATDFDQYAVKTFNQNVAPVAFLGDMQNDAVIEQLVGATVRRDTSRPLALVGGPPCQGFSTGGKRRSENDIRNKLYSRYSLLLSKLKPDVFVFENVLGLLSMSRGVFLKQIIAEFEAVGYDVVIWKMNAAEYGVPQRRQRVLIVGVPNGRLLPVRPSAWTSATDADLLKALTTTTVAEALGDLPPLEPGEDGSHKGYVCDVLTQYQALMRGKIQAAEYLDLLALETDRVAA